MQKYDFRVDVCSNKHKHRPFTTQTKGKRFGLENAPVEKGFLARKSCRGNWGSLEDCIRKSTRDSTKWAYKIFNIKKWQPFAGLESCSFALDKAKIQRLDTNIVNMSAESLNLWLAKLIQKVYKGNGQRYPGRTLYSMVCYLVVSSVNNCTINIGSLSSGWLYYLSINYPVVEIKYIFGWVWI